MSSWSERLDVLLRESPFRLLTRAAVKRLPVSLQQKARWDTDSHPAYLHGVLHAALEAARVQQPEISVIEFGVAGGVGLLALQRCARRVESATDVRIQVFGFDTGRGLPRPLSDHRDHPDQWQEGDYPMDVDLLRPLLAPRTELILGDIVETGPAWLDRANVAPVGFAAVDLDLYSAARAALSLIASRRPQPLLRTALYLDDVVFFFNHSDAGELLAVREFNGEHDTKKVDRWRGIRHMRPFPESTWLDQMFMMHHLDNIAQFEERRPPARLDCL